MTGEVSASPRNAGTDASPRSASLPSAVKRGSQRSAGTSKRKAFGRRGITRNVGKHIVVQTVGRNVRLPSPIRNGGGRTGDAVGGSWKNESVSRIAETSVDVQIMQTRSAREADLRRSMILASLMTEERSPQQVVVITLARYLGKRCHSPTPTTLFSIPHNNALLLPRSFAPTFLA